MTEVMDRLDIIGSRKYQDWLAKRGMLVRSEFNPDDWTVIPGPKKRPVAEQVWPILREAAGYLVSARELARTVHGFSGEYERGAIYRTGKSLKASLKEPDSMTVKLLGQGLGVRDLSPSSEEILLPLYSLWEDLGKFVSTRVLCQRVYGEVNINTAAETRDRFLRLERRMKVYGVDIEGVDINREKYYRIKEPDEADEAKAEAKKENGGFKGHFNKAYQDWLEDHGLIELKPNFRRLDFREGEIMEGRQLELVKRLLGNTGYIVPLEAMRGVYFQGSLPENWRDRINRRMYVVRGKCVNPDDILPLVQGWAVGINRVNLPLPQMAQLYPLWKNEEDFVPAEQLERDGIVFRGAIVGEIRDALEGTGYLIGSRKVEKKVDRKVVRSLEYILIHQDRLVMSQQESGDQSRGKV
jgi:hypothetical protein